MFRRILITIGLVLLWIVIISAAAFAEAFWFARPDVVRGDLSSIENHLVRSLNGAVEDKSLGSASMALVQNGAVAAEHGFGVGNADTNSPVETDRTLYQMASVSKAVTAWGVMRLVQEGKLSLDEPVMHRLTRWQFPGTDGYRSQVTVRHLLSHTAGLDEGSGFGGGVLMGERVPTVEESLNSAPVTIKSAPGTGMTYGNANFAILQLLIEEITHREFSVYMKESVLEPLGMTKSSFGLAALTADGRERDLAPNFDSWLRPQPRRQYSATAAVALYSTSEDMGRFAAAFRGNNPVLNDETLQEMMTPQDGTSGTWGMGLHLFAENDVGGHIVGHDGGAYPAWGSMVRANPATGNAFVLMVSGSRGAVNQLGHDWVYWETGKMTSGGRRQVFYDRLFKGAGLTAIAIGAIAIILVQALRALRRPTLAM